MITPAAAKELIDRIAGSPRPAGSAAEAAARSYIAEYLTRAGFLVAEHPFAYSAWPGRWGVPTAGVALLMVWMVVGGGMWRGWSHSALMAFVISAVVGLLLTGVAGARAGTRYLPWLRCRSSNLVARRAPGLGGTAGLDPSIWLVAHLDTKWQPISIGVRAGSIVMQALALGGLVVVLAFNAGGDWRNAMVWSLVLVGGLSAIPIAASTVGQRSAGALDNASGVAAILLAASDLPSSLGVGVAITSAEELALAGATAWAAEMPPGRAINCDTVDDVGVVQCMWVRKRALAKAAAGIAKAHGASARHILPGILVDAHALDRAGWDTVTVSKGTLRTLGRLHTAADTAGATTGTGAAQAARFISQLVRTIETI